VSGEKQVNAAKIAGDLLLERWQELRDAELEVILAELPLANCNANILQNIFDALLNCTLSLAKQTENSRMVISGHMEDGQAWILARDTCGGDPEYRLEFLENTMESVHLSGGRMEVSLQNEEFVTQLEFPAQGSQEWDSLWEQDAPVWKAKTKLPDP